MNTLYFILFLIAAICFALASITHPATTNLQARARINLVALGLFAFSLVYVIRTGKAL